MLEYDKKYNIPEGRIDIKYVNENEIEIRVDGVEITNAN